jgi:hypothetical protein
MEARRLSSASQLTAIMQYGEQLIAFPAAGSISQRSKSIFIMRLPWPSADGRSAFPAPSWPASRSGEERKKTYRTLAGYQVGINNPYGWFGAAGFAGRMPSPQKRVAKGIRIVNLEMLLQAEHHYYHGKTPGYAGATPKVWQFRECVSPHGCSP